MKLPIPRCHWCGGPYVQISLPGLEPYVCSQPECAARQLEHAVWVQHAKKDRLCVYVPTPKGVDFTEAKEPKVLLGGAAGGSKSYGGRWWIHTMALRHPGLRALLIREKLTELKTTHVQEGLEIEEGLLGGAFNRTDLVFRYPNGSILQLGHLDNISQYLSTQYDLLFADEMVTLPWEKLELLFSRIGRRRKFPSRVAGGTNPGGKEAYPVKRHWIDKNISLEEEPFYNPDEWRYIEARVEDNPYLSPDYAKTLANLPHDLREAYLFGNWDIFPGQFFMEWRKGRHVKPHIDYSPELLRVCSVDWGYIRPGCVGWYVILPDGHVFKEREWVFQRTHAPLVAQEIAKVAKSSGFPRIRYVGDNQMWTPSNQTGESIAETFQRYGVSMSQVTKERINGWIRVRAWLRDAPDGEPWMTVSDRCPYTIRTVPAMVMDDHSPEDIDSDSEDHAVDEMRYFAMSRPAPETFESKVIFKPGTAGSLRQQIAERQGVKTW